MVPRFSLTESRAILFSAFDCYRFFEAPEDLT